MKRYIFIISLILFLFFNSGSVNAAEKTPTPQDNPRVDNRLKNYLKKENINGIILVNKNGQQPKVISNQEPDIASYYRVEPDKYYPIASLQKIATGVMIYNLVQEGKLKWNTPISKFFPKIKKLQGITLWQLLCHQSGIHDNCPMPKKILETEPDRIDFLLNHIKVTKENKWHYASTNYGLLAIIIRKVTGKTYEQCLEELCSSPNINHMKLFNEINNFNQVTLPVKSSTKKVKLLLKALTFGYLLLKLKNIDCAGIFPRICNWDLERGLSQYYGADDMLATPNSYWNFMYHFLLNNPKIYKSFLQKAKYTNSGYFGGTYFRKKNFIFAVGGTGTYNCGDITADYKTKRMLMIFTNNITYKQLQIVKRNTNRIYFNQDIS